MVDIGEIPEVLITPNHGGTADSWDPSGLGLHSTDFVIPGVATNHDPVSGGTAAGLPSGHGNPQAAVQRALDQIGNPAVPSELAWQAPYLGPTTFATEVAAYDLGARLRAAIGTPGFFGPSGPPEVYPFLRPAPDTREASSPSVHGMAVALASIALAAAFAPEGVALLGLEEGSAAALGFEGLISMVIGWGISPFGEPVGLQDTNPTQIDNDRIYADQQRSNGMRNWLADFLTDAARDPEFFPYGDRANGLLAILKMFNLNYNIGGGGIGPLNGYSGLPAFPVFEQMFGPETPPLFMGTKALVLSNDFSTPDYPIFSFGPLNPPDYSY